MWWIRQSFGDRRARALTAWYFAVGCGSDGSERHNAELSDAAAGRPSVPPADSSDAARERPPAPPVIASLDTLAGYTQACGQELGPVPAIDCRAGQRVPMTVNGVEAEEVFECDRPSFLFGCTKTAWVGRLKGRHWDDAANPDVSWVFFCRDLDKTPQIAVIGHHRQTGATCFFESRKDVTGSELPAPLPNPDDPATARDDLWRDPASIGEVRCPDCHDADPWIHSPFIDQVKDPENPGVPLVPSGADRNRPYYAVASPFPQWSRQVALEGNACLQCHRIGTGDRAAIFVRAVTDRAQFDPRSDWARDWPQSHSMPPDGASSLDEWNAAYGDSVTALLDCLEGPSQDHCTTEIPGAR